MITAKDARLQSRSTEDVQQLWDIAERIRIAAQEGRRSVTNDGLNSYLVRDIIKDEGYLVTPCEQGVVISW